jgi:hypothetical protein
VSDSGLDGRRALRHNVCDKHAHYSGYSPGVISSPPLPQEARPVAKHLSPLLALLAGVAMSAASAVESPTNAESGTAFSDEVRFGVASDEQQHRLVCTGAVASENLLSEMGGLHDRFAARTISGKGSSLTVEVSAALPGQPLLIEVEELHQRRPNAFGYTVQANGQDVYVRTYQEYGDGPNHYFLSIPSAIAGAGAGAGAGAAPVVRLTFRNDGAAPFSLGRLWSYRDFFTQVVEREQVFKPMALYVHEKLDEVVKDPNRRNAYAGMTCYAPVGILSFLNYGSGNLTQQNTEILRTLQLSAEMTLPIILQINGTGWGGKPSGPDGLGGFFSDACYSGLSYNHASGTYQASWPNMWGSMAWPTLRNDTMNRFLETRFQATMAGFQEQLDLLRARGTTINPVLIREWGLGGSDITNTTISKAKADGLTLDPSDGLDANERRWMYREAVAMWQRFAASTIAQVGRDSIRVDNGRVTLPSGNTLDDIYSQPNFLDDEPMSDPRWNGGQLGMTEGLWSSGEMGKGVEYREIAMYDYLRARGKLANVNMERTILKEDFSVLRRHYERGFQYVTLFNSEKNDHALVKKVDGVDDQPALPPVHREPSLLDLLISRDRHAGAPEQLQAIDNVVVQRDLRLGVGDCSRPGTVTYRLDLGGEPFTTALNLRLDGRVSVGPGNRIDILLGDSPENLRPVKTLTNADLPCPDHWTPYMTTEAAFDLGMALVGKKAGFLRLVFHSADAPDAAFLLSLHVGTQWPRSSGHLAGNPFTVRQSRTMQLWVQERALAEHMLATYHKQAGEDATGQRARELISHGWYRSAYLLLCGNYAELLPARYALRGNGELGQHPVRVDLGQPDAVAIIHLLAVSPEGVEFRVSGAKDGQSIALRFLDLEPGKAWSSEVVALNHYRIRAATAGTTPLPVDRGPVGISVTYTTQGSSAPPLPRTLVGRFLTRAGNRITVDLQDLALMRNEHSLSLDLAPNAVIERRPADSADAAPAGTPQHRDQVALTINEQGLVTTVLATYGADRGRITAYTPPVLVGKLTNGSIQLDNGHIYTLDFSPHGGTQFDLASVRGRIVESEIRHLAKVLRVGQEVEVTYSPYAEAGGSMRLLSITQPYRTLLEEDYVKTTDEAWKSRAVSVDGVDVKPHKPEPNYLYNVVKRLLRPTQAYRLGNVVYRITSDRPLAGTSVEFTARAFEDSSRVTFLVSTDDGATWTSCGQFDNTWQNCYSQQLDDLPPSFIDLSAAVQGKTAFLLKVELAVSDADERYCLGRIRVLSEGK